jgi:hypothetical protein
VKKLIEENQIRKKLSEEKEYTYINPFDRTSSEFIKNINALWKDECLKWLLISMRQDLYSIMIKADDKDAVKYKNQITGIESVIKAMEGFAKKYEQIQIPQTKRTQ